MRKLLSLLILSSCLFLSCSSKGLNPSSQYIATTSRGFYIKSLDNTRQLYMDNIFEDIEYYKDTLIFRDKGKEIILSNIDEEKLFLEMNGTWLYTTIGNYNKFKNMKKERIKENEF